MAASRISCDHEIRGVEYDIAVIGGGPAGMAAALSADGQGCSALLIERSHKLGGILSQCIHSGFGLSYFGEELTGVEYAARFAEKINKSYVRVALNTSAVSMNSDKTIILSGCDGLSDVHPKAVILASGCRERPIGTLDIAGTRPSGIFTAGAAQKMINVGGYDIGDRFIILGSGDVGLIMGRQLKQSGKEIVAVIEKEDHCGGLERNRIGFFEHNDIPLWLRSTISVVHGTERICGVTVRNLETGMEWYAECDALITSVGLIPECELSEQASDGGRLPEWLFLCGNACYVHDLVDDVAIEAERLGKIAAQYVRSGMRKDDLPEARVKHSANGLFCIACPKACPLTEIENGYSGALCGRAAPVPNIVKAS
ncbi:MAG: FAD-dependent oxidoreductase [Synergistaceae bacterium]|jgi:thioredoxin reductase|nr:FAD-dependent oxidoreductase [Synergistaceae bacterium]